MNSLDKVQKLKQIITKHTNNMYHGDIFTSSSLLFSSSIRQSINKNVTKLFPDELDISTPLLLYKKVNSFILFTETKLYVSCSMPKYDNIEFGIINSIIDLNDFHNIYLNYYNDMIMLMVENNLVYIGDKTNDIDEYFITMMTEISHTIDSSQSYPTINTEIEDLDIDEITSNVNKNKFITVFFNIKQYEQYNEYKYFYILALFLKYNKNYNNKFIVRKYLFGVSNDDSIKLYFTKIYVPGIAIIYNEKLYSYPSYYSNCIREFNDIYNKYLRIEKCVDEEEMHKQMSLFKKSNWFENLSHYFNKTIYYIRYIIILVIVTLIIRSC